MEYSEKVLAAGRKRVCLAVVTRYHIPSAVLVVVGVAVIVQGFQTIAFAPAEYHHRLEPVDESAAPTAAHATNVTNLSTAGRDAVLAALQSSDGEATVSGAASRPPDFAYPDDYIEIGHGRYFLQYQGEFYELTTVADHPMRGLGGRWGDSLSSSTFSAAARRSSSVG